MRSKALLLTLVLLASALAGCIGEDVERTEDITSDNDRNDLNDLTEVSTEQSDCEDAGGTWIETTDRPIEGYCSTSDDDRENEQEITQEDCERRGGNWTEAAALS